MIKLLASLSALILALTAFVFTLTYEPPEQVLGGQVGIPTRVATTSTVQVGLQDDALLFEPTGGIAYSCDSRIVTTKAQAIVINFAGTSTSTATSSLSSIQGHIQLASTTVVYDAGIYGCGYWGALAVTASSSVIAATTTVTVTETR